MVAISREAYQGGRLFQAQWKAPCARCSRDPGFAPALPSKGDEGRTPDPTRSGLSVVLAGPDWEEQHQIVSSGVHDLAAGDAADKTLCEMGVTACLNCF